MFPTLKGFQKTKYLVMVKGGDAPQRRHESYGEAKKEAQRLTKKTGKPSYVLQILKKYEIEVMETGYKNVTSECLAKKRINKPKTLIKHQTYKEKTNFKL